MTEPYYQGDLVTLLHGDCLDVMAELSDASVDAVVTDPPYGLEFMGKSWDRLSDDAVASSWDTRGRTMTDAPTRDPSSPGGRSGASLYRKDNPRCDNCGRATNGRATQKGFKVCECAIPAPRLPATSARKMQSWHEGWAREAFRVLKPGGHLLAFGGTRTWHHLTCAIEDAGFEIRDSIAFMFGQGFPKSLDVSKAIDRAAGAEREVVGVNQYAARRPGVGSSEVWNNQGPGLGGASSANITSPATPEAEQWQGWGTALKPAHEPIVVARKPLTGTVAATVLQHGTGALNIDGCRIGTDDDRSRPPAAGMFMLDGFSTLAELRAAADAGRKTPKGRDAAATLSRYLSASRTESHAAGRWPANVILDESQAEALDQMSGETVAAGPSERSGLGGRSGGIMGEVVERTGGRTGHSDSGGASRFFYTAKADSGERITHNGVAHPTVKPLSLMRWLVRLVTPPGGLILEPFAGSGTTVEAAILEGFRCVAIERESDYLPLITQRIHRRRDPIAYLTEGGHDLGLFDDEDGAA